ncbi:hypothetical protein V8D89_007936 [Ganoderma adspersum]
MGSNEPVGWGQPPPPPRLNFDILHLVCNDLTEVSDVLSFALTCSALRKGALQRRLSMSPVALSSPDSVERFHRFIFADPTSRAPHLYGLSISPEFYYAEHEDSPISTKYLAAILETAIHFEYLYVPTSIALSVCTTVAKMTTIRELAVFSDCGAHIQHEPEALNSLLAALRSPLQHLSIADHKMGKMSAGFLHDHLFYLAPILESLTLGDSEFSFNISPSSVTTPFAALRSLEISAIYQFDFYRMDVLLRLFPNLDDTLILKGFSALAHQPPALREQSKEAQEDHTWPGLDRVTLSATLAFAMALRCPIRYMCIDSSVLHETRDLADALRDSCPQQLLLPITLFARDHLHHLDGLFPPEAAKTLTHLVLFVEVEVNRFRRPTGQWENISWDQLMACLVRSIAHLHLTHLRIIFHHDIHPPESEPGHPAASAPAIRIPPDEDFAQNVAHDADLYPAATRLVDAMQTLQYVLLTTCGVRRYGEPWMNWHSSKAWCVVDADEDVVTPGYPPDSGRLSCVEISSEEAQAVIDEEELHLSYREENMMWHCIKNASK